MSSAADIVRELSEALNVDDTERMAATVHPDVVQYGTRGGIDQARVVRGREAVLQYWDETAEMWESLRFEPERLLEYEDLVVAFWRETGRSRHSDLEVESQTATVFRVRDGLIIEMTGYLDRDEALRAAGWSRAGRIDRRPRSGIR
jgi:ketosteroid isomerase-like protein